MRRTYIDRNSGVVVMERYGGKGSLYIRSVGECANTDLTPKFIVKDNRTVISQKETLTLLPYNLFDSVKEIDGEDIYVIIHFTKEFAIGLEVESLMTFLNHNIFLEKGFSIGRFLYENGREIQIEHRAGGYYSGYVYELVPNLYKEELMKFMFHTEYLNFPNEEICSLIEFKDKLRKREFI